MSKFMQNCIGICQFYEVNTKKVEYVFSCTEREKSSYKQQPHHPLKFTLRPTSMHIITLNLPSIVKGGEGVADTAPQEVGDIRSVGAGHTKDICSSAQCTIISSIIFLSMISLV